MAPHRPSRSAPTKSSRSTKETTIPCGTAPALSADHKSCLDPASSTTRAIFHPFLSSAEPQLKSTRVLHLARDLCRTGLALSKGSRLPGPIAFSMISAAPPPLPPMDTLCMRFTRLGLTSDHCGRGWVSCSKSSGSGFNSWVICKSPASSGVRPYRALRDFVRYSRSSSPAFYRQGETISTAFVESTINQVVSGRFVKKQQMHCTLRGAHLLLQARTKALSNELEKVFQRWYPLFRVQVTAA
jgi:hypothetical protein